MMLLWSRDCHLPGGLPIGCGFAPLCADAVSVVVVFHNPTFAFCRSKFALASDECFALDTLVCGDKPIWNATEFVVHFLPKVWSAEDLCPLCFGAIFRIGHVVRVEIQELIDVEIGGI